MANWFNGRTGILIRKFKSLIYYFLFLKEKLRDKFLKVDFTSPVSKHLAGTENINGAYYYASSGFLPELVEALRYLKITSNDSILDYGSGKAAALVKMNDFPFKKICGIELSENLVDISNSNLHRLNMQHIKIIHGDAIKFKQIDEFNFFYFFNPFDQSVFSHVLNNIFDSFSNHPRRIILVYCNPTCYKLIEETGRFSLIKLIQHGARSLRIYQIKMA